jgi:hypothetical protein
MADIFISHSGKDNDVAADFYPLLAEVGKDKNAHIPVLQ